MASRACVHGRPVSRSASTVWYFRAPALTPGGGACLGGWSGRAGPLRPFRRSGRAPAAFVAGGPALPPPLAALRARPARCARGSLRLGARPAVVIVCMAKGEGPAACGRAFASGVVTVCMVASVLASVFITPLLSASTSSDFGAPACSLALWAQGGKSFPHSAGRLLVCTACGHRQHRGDGPLDYPVCDVVTP